MKTSYLDYAMSVIVSRALPDVRDGLKPVHRRILYACQEAGYVAGRPYRKSSRIVGDVMGKYHPHGDSAIYDALARMTQDWSMRVPLIDGQGNFGSMDPDPPAAMRYTEARLAKVANFLLGDIDRDTVDFQPNYDASEREPQVLPARFPNLLVNGAGGIAVGMATNIPPHNLGEVLAACRAYIDDPGDQLRRADGACEGPGLPDRRLHPRPVGNPQRLHDRPRLDHACAPRHHVEEGRGERRSIVLTEIPYQVGKNGLVEKIAEAAKDKRIEGVSDIRDESNREGVRIVIDLKRDATPEVVLNQLWRHTPAQSSFPANMLAIRGGRPETLTLRDFIESFVRFREEVITRRSKFELFKARERAHILLGLVVAVTNLDEVVRLIRGSASPAEAREKLLEREWAGDQIRPYIQLVEAVEPQAAGEELQAVRSAGEGDPRASPPSPHRARPRRDRQRARRARQEHRRAARDSRQSRSALRGDARGVRRGRSRVRDAARDRTRPRRRRHRGRGPDRARGHGRDRDHGADTSSARRSPCSASRSAAARAAPAWRPRKRTRSPPCS